MNPADVSCRTSRLIGYLPIVPDNMVRDPRKIAFFDLPELDPGKGESTACWPPYKQWPRRAGCAR